MNTYRVEVEVVGQDEDAVLERLGLRGDDAVVTLVQPKLGPGWYQDITETDEPFHGSITYVDEPEDLEYLSSNFEEYRRVKDPEPYDAPKVSRFVVGERYYYQEDLDGMPNGTTVQDRDDDLWLKVDGEWTSTKYGFVLRAEDYSPFTVLVVGL